MGVSFDLPTCYAPYSKEASYIAKLKTTKSILSFSVHKN